MKYYAGENIQEGIQEAAKLGLRLEEDPWGCTIAIYDNGEVEFSSATISKTIYDTKNKTYRTYNDYGWCTGTYEWDESDYYEEE